MPAYAKFCGKCRAPMTAKPPATNCNACQAPLVPGAKFCGGCGANLAGPESSSATAPPAGQKCLNCGLQLPPRARFCGKCRTPVGSTAPLAAARTGMAGSSASPVSAVGGGIKDSSSAPSAGGAILFVVNEEAVQGPTNLKALLDKVSSTHPNSRVLSVSRAHAIGKVQQAIKFDQDSGSKLEAVCLIGDSGQLSMTALDDDTGKDDACFTDNMYGMADMPSDEQLR